MLVLGAQKKIRDVTKFVIKNHINNFNKPKVYIYRKFNLIEQQ